MEFRTDAVFNALQAPLALVDDPERRAAFERYVEAARFPLERAIFDLLSTLVTAVDEQTREHYRVRLGYQPGALSLDVTPVEPSPPPAGAAAADEEREFTFNFSDDETEKVTIRIPAGLKDMAQRAAGDAGLSANSWFVRALARSLRAAGEEMERRGSRPHGPRVASIRISRDDIDEDEIRESIHESLSGLHDARHHRRGPGQKLEGWIGE